MGTDAVVVLTCVVVTVLVSVVDAPFWKMVVVSVIVWATGLGITM